MKVQDVINRVSILLEDVGNVRWTVSELTNWVSDAQRTIFIARPDTSSVVESIPLVTGSKQSLPSSGVRLLDVIRNMGLDGMTPGAAIRYIDRESMDTQLPGWHTASPNAVVKNFIYDNRYPKTFYVFPPNTGATFVEAVYTKVPAALTLPTNDLTLDDSYQDSVVNYVMYRAYSKNTELAQNAGLANMYLSLFDRLLGGQKASDVAYQPDLNSKGAAPASTAISAGGV